MFRHLVRKIEEYIFSRVGKEVQEKFTCKDAKEFAESLYLSGISISAKNSCLNIDLGSIDMAKEEGELRQSIKSGKIEKSQIDDTLRKVVENSNLRKEACYLNRGSLYFFNRHNSRFMPIDDGLIDIISPEYISANWNDLNEVAKNAISPIIEYINSIQKHQYGYSHSSLYLYKDVYHPRSLHVDSLSPQLKFFLPLSSINSVSEGPYAYIARSHRLKYVHIFSYLLNKIVKSDIGNNPRDASLFSSIMATPLLIEAGSIYASDNTGVHGDLPLQYGKSFSKQVLVLNYT